jgi:phosphate-selective porin
VSASYRHGDYDRIAPRPGLHDVNRITLAQPDADTQALVGLEGLAGRGSLHGEMELYYSDYSGGDVDAEGWGGYGQVGWMFGGKRRLYQPRWGVWAPVQAGNEHIFEVFGRVSFTHGNDNVNSSNDLGLLTLGGNWYYRNFRVSANVILAETKRDISDEGSGHAIGLRLQYLF